MRKILIILVVLNIATMGYALRVSRPLALTMPITQDQLNQLNVYLSDIWNIQNGRVEFDIVTTSKTGAKEGEIWIYNNAGTYSIQTKAGGVVRSAALTP